MTNNEFQKFYKDLLSKESSLVRAKGVEYAPKADRFNNFKDAAKLQVPGHTPEGAAWNIATKHIVAVKYGLERLAEKDGPDEAFWREKLGDIRVYCALIEAMLHERIQEENKAITQKLQESR